MNPPLLPDRQVVEAREAARAAAFLAAWYPDGNPPPEARKVAEQCRAQYVACALTPYRPGLPALAFRRLHTSWEAYVEGREQGVVYDFWVEKDGTPVYKLHEEPAAQARPVASYAGWEDLAFRPWCWTWQEAEERLTAQGVSP